MQGQSTSEKCKKILNYFPKAVAGTKKWDKPDGLWKISVHPEKPAKPQETKQGKPNQQDNIVHGPLVVVLLTLKLVGILPLRYDRQSGLYESKWRSIQMIHTILTFVWLNILVVTSSIGLTRMLKADDFFATSKRKNNDVELLCLAITLGCLLNAWVSVSYAIRNRAFLCRFINEWHKMARETGLNPIKGLKKKTYSLVFFLYTFLILAIIACIFGGDTLRSAEDTLAKVLLLIPQEWLTHRSSALMALQAAIVIVICHLYMVYKGAIFVFVITCHGLNTVLQQWKEELLETLDAKWKEQSHKDDPLDSSILIGLTTITKGVEDQEERHPSGVRKECVGLAELVQSHWVIVKMVRDTEKIFSPALQSFYATQLVTLCLELYAVAYRVSIEEPYRSEEMAWQTIIIAQTFFVFFLVSIKASYIYDEAASSVDVLRRGLPFTATKKDKFHFNELVTSLTSSPICITGGGFFYINRPFIITVIGAVVSYFIIILQLMLPSVQAQVVEGTKFVNISVPPEI